MSLRPYFRSPPRTHFDEPSTMHYGDHFPHFHHENTMSTPYSQFHYSTYPRSLFRFDPFSTHSSDTFSHFLPKNTMATPYSPFHCTTDPRPHFYYDPFTMHNWDHFPHLHPENTIATPYIPFHYNNRAPFGSTRAEWHDTPEAHVLKAEVPGFEKDEVKVNVEEGNVLKISCERKVEKEENHENWHSAKLIKGKFLRSFPLPENCKPGHITTSFEGGVLIVTVPKADAVNNYVRMPIKD